MTTTTDTAGVLIRPPIALAFALAGGMLLDRVWRWPLPWSGDASRLIGIATCIVAVALAAWAIVTFGRAGTNVPTSMPSTRLALGGPYRFSRNPIYVGMLLLLAGLALALNCVWLAVTWVPFFLVLRYGVVAREEAYLAAKFGDDYRAFKGRVRRWL